MAGTKASLKFGMFLAAVCGLWWLWENDAAMDALMSFIMAGVVPGSGKVLTPEQMYAIMGATLLLAIMIIFRSETNRAVRRRRRPVIEPIESIEMPEVVVKQPDPQPKPVIEPQPALVIHIPGQRGAISRGLHAMRSHLARSASSGRRAAAVNGNLVVAFSRVILVATYNWQKDVRYTLGVLAKKAVARLSVWLKLLRGLMVKLAITTWVFAEPKLYRFDKFIERKLKENKDTAAMLRASNEFTRNVGIRITDLRARLTRGLQR